MQRNQPIQTGEGNWLLNDSEQAHAVGSRHFLNGREKRSVHIALALGARRQALAAWHAQNVSEGYATSPADVSVTAAPPGGTFGPRIHVETIPRRKPYIEQPSIRVAVTAGRRQLLWIGADDAGSVLRAAQVTDGRLTARQNLSRRGAAAFAVTLATTDDGAMLASWSDAAGLWAAARSPRARSFGAAELVDAAGLFGSPAIDPTRHQAALVWMPLRQRPAPEGPRPRFAIRAPFAR